MKFTQNTIVVLLICIALNSCVERLPIETQNFESILVVEGTITNEFKRQTIKLSRTFLLENSEPIIENNATVTVTDSEQNSFSFIQNSSGDYVSSIEFEAQPNTTYNLEIITNDGIMYKSKNTELTPISQIDELYAEYVDENNGPGVQVFVDSDNQSTNAQFFRYEYEETYKIVAPQYLPVKAVLSNYEEFVGLDINVFYDTSIVNRTQEEQTCYVSATNKNIIQTSTSSLNENTVLRFPVRFITEEQGDEPIEQEEIEENKTIEDLSIIRDRYSILVKQYVQSQESYAFYKIINQLGNNENILSENQPGFVQGNINVINSPKAKVIGFFDVSSVSEKRIFFDATDFNIPTPRYIYECIEKELDYNDNTLTDMSFNQRKEIYRLITEFNYQITQDPRPIGDSNWKLVNPECSDCTTVGSNIEPDFWED
ncbi:DUF4249 domain-containing protein [Pontimicrobium sp. MEBiC06410]